MPLLFTLLKAWFGLKLIDQLMAGGGGFLAPTPSPPPPTPVRTTPTPVGPRRRKVVRPSPAPPPVFATPPPLASAPAPVTVVAPPWPQVVPAGLPPFPGPGWEPDTPPPGPVVGRANALLTTLWRSGAGTFKVEQTAGRWIAYRATPMGSKRGVVAYRLRPGAAEPLPTGVVPASLHRVSPVQTSAPSTSLPTLQRGSKGPDVVILQQRLHITADGKFGPGTEAAVKNFQRSRGLVADGIVGRMTWAALMG